MSVATQVVPAKRPGRKSKKLDQQSGVVAAVPWSDDEMEEEYDDEDESENIEVTTFRPRSLTFVISFPSNDEHVKFVCVVGSTK